MSQPPGATSRQSPLFQSLNRFTPDGIEALAVIGLMLSESIEHRYLVVNDSYPLDIVERTKCVIAALYLLLDSLHGSSEKLPAALAVFVAAVEGANHG